MKSLRARLAADPEVGTGNVLQRVIAHGADLDGPGLTFDTPVDDYPAEYPLTLGELDERVQARTAWLHEHGIGRRDVVAIWATDAAWTARPKTALKMRKIRISWKPSTAQ